MTIGANTKGNLSQETYRTIILSAIDEVLKIMPELVDLADRIEDLPICLRPEWWVTHLEAWGLDDQLLIITIRDANDKLVGVAPFFRSEARIANIIGLKVLRPIGSRSNTFEYSGWLADCSSEEVYLQMAGYLASNPSAFDLIWLPKTLPRLADPIKNACSSWGMGARSRVRDFSAIELPDTLEKYERLFPRKSRKRLRGTTRRAFRDADLEFVRCQAEEDLDEFLEALFDLHCLRWSSIGKTGAFERSPNESHFYEVFSPLALKKGWLEIYGLRTKTRWLAVQYGYSFNGIYYQIQEGFLPDKGSSNGNVLRHLVIGDLIKRGFRRYDFMEGWTNHKRHWRATRSQGLDALLGNGSIRSCLLLRLPIWPKGRFFDWTD